jgi:hypothetical protein
VSQNVIPSKNYFDGASPFAFTEQMVAQQRFDEISLLKSGEEIAQDWKDRAQIGFKK